MNERRVWFWRACCATLSLLCACAAVMADFTDEFQSALKLFGESKHAEASVQFAALAVRAPTAGSKSVSLRYAVLSAISAKQLAKAEELLAQIPRESTKKLCRMNLLLAQRQPQELVKCFKDENLTEWSDVHVYDALMARGQAFRSLRQFAEALKDFAKAEEFATTPNKQTHVLNLAGSVLIESGEDGRALTVYRRMKGISSLKGYGIINDAIISAARILAKQGKYKEALREMDGITPAISGYWHARPFIVRAEIHAAQGRKAEAIENYNKALQSAPDDLRGSIQAALEKLR
ncbi:MAG: tetratricopeptide repeat protein [Verrucomicrobia bacterium]|nr:tetratricopeptide repeat protein [Verrucomicrobiota bacterium]